MPSFGDSAVIFILALLLFGPKKLPVLARELGKWIGEFRRASNEFKMQMEEELRLSEQAERDQKLAAIEASAPPVAALEGVPTEEPEHPHMSDSSRDYAQDYDAEHFVQPSEPTAAELPTEPIASNGDLNLMPPATGLPVARSTASSDSIAPLVDSIPVVETAHIETPSHTEPAAENAAHG